MILDHAALIVSDLAVSLNFYEKFLDLKIKREFELSEKEAHALFNIASPARAIQLTMDKGMIELFDFKKGIAQTDGPSDPPSNGLFHLAFQISEPVEEFINRARREDIPVFSITRGTHEIYFIRDPDGILIEVKE